MRPLVYTEFPPSAEHEPASAPRRQLNVAPEDLGYGIFHALVDRDRSMYDAMFVSAEELSDLVRLKHDDAVRQSAGIKSKSEILWKLFTPDIPAEDPIGGISDRLRLTDFRLGKGRNLAGKISMPNKDDTVQHWGNELRIELVGTDKTFVIRIPKIVKTSAGWRIAQPIEMDRTLRLYLENGMHLRGDLLTSFHYPIPLDVGNYWKYVVDDDGWSARGDVAAGASGKPPSAQQPTVTDSITSIIRRDGYWIVSFERTSSGGDQLHETFAWIATPHAVFPCARDCRNNADNIGYLLGYMLYQTPLFVFPMEYGTKWGDVSKPDKSKSPGRIAQRYEVRSPRDLPVSVPDGTFHEVYEISGQGASDGGTRESRYFVPGIGVVMRTVRGGVANRRESLLTHRLIQ